MKNKLNNILIFLYLALFPFGQLPNLIFSLWRNQGGGFYPSDIVLGILLILNLKNILKIKALWAITFSLIFSLLYFQISDLSIGFLYFVRLVSFINLGIVIHQNIVKKKEEYRYFYFLLLGISLMALFGWIQYLFIPDLRALSILGWDDHYFRLVSTLLDPTFTGIMLVLGLLLSLFIYKSTKRKIFFFLGLLLLLTLGFTYSRSSYLATLAGTGFLLWQWIPKKILGLGLVLMVISIFLLPRPAGGEGVKLERLFSVESKIQNTAYGLTLFKSNPVFGYGYNNVCVLQMKEVKTNTFIKSNSCSGFDNSVVFLLITTGIVGCMVLIGTYLSLIFNIEEPYKILAYALTIAVFVHGIFTNTFVYPWVLGFMAIIFGVTSRRSNKLRERK